MRYRHVLIFQIHGLFIKEDEPTQIFIDTPELRVFFGRDIYDYAADVILRAAIASAMLIRFGRSFQGVSSDISLENDISSQIEVLQEQRRQLANGQFLVFEYHGYVEGFNTDGKEEFNDYNVYHDGIDKSRVLEGQYEKFVAATMSIVLETGAVIALEKLHEASIFYSEDGKPGYSMKLEASGEGYVGNYLEPHEREAVAHRYPQLLGQESLQRVVRLLVFSLDKQADKLRAFLSAWAALEVFTGKAFQEYENDLFDDLRAGDRPGVWGGYLDRIRSVMKDKYRLTDKFAVIAMHLAPAEADADLQIFKRCKDQRDAIAHGSEVDEKELPVAYTQHLVKKYLRLHLDRQNRTTNQDA